MTRRPVVLLALLAVGFASLAVAATLRYLVPQIEVVSFNYNEETDQVAIDQYYAWIRSGAVYYQQAPWLVAAALIAGIAALALAAYRAQRRIELAGVRTTAPRAPTARDLSTVAKPTPTSSTASRQ